MTSKLLLFLLIPSFALTQQTVDVDKGDMSPIKNGLFYTVAGVPFSLYKYVRVVSGSPFFNDQWMKGIAILPNGGRARCDFIKLDLLSGEIVYKDSTGSELIATTPISLLILTDTVSGKEYTFTRSLYPSDKRKNGGWYQLLESGTASLYKRIQKNISESRPFNSATTEQTINTSSFYYIEISNEIISVKKTKDIPAVLSDKKKELEEYIVTNKLNGKTDIDFINVVTRYNFLAVNN